MTKPTTAAECIKLPIRLKPANTKEKCCRFSWGESELKAVDHKTVHVASELFEAERLLRAARDKLTAIIANHPDTLGKFKEQIEPFWRALYSESDELWCRVDLNLIACYLIAEATHDDT